MCIVPLFILSSIIGNDFSDDLSIGRAISCAIAYSSIESVCVSPATFLACAISKCVIDLRPCVFDGPSKTPQIQSIFQSARGFWRPMVGRLDPSWKFMTLDDTQLIVAAVGCSLSSCLRPGIDYAMLLHCNHVFLK